MSQQENKDKKGSAARAAGAVKNAAKAASNFAAGNYLGAAKETVSFLSKPEAWAMIVAIAMVPILLVYAVGYTVSEIWTYMFDPDASVTSVLDDYLIKQSKIEQQAFSKAYKAAADTALEKIAKKTQEYSFGSGMALYTNRKNEIIFKDAASVKNYIGMGYMQLVQFQSAGNSYSMYKDASDGRTDVIVVSEDTSNGFTVDYAFNEDNSIKSWTKTATIIDLGTKRENVDPSGRDAVLYRIRYHNGKFISGGVNINTLEYLYNQVYDAREMQAAEQFEKDTILPFLYEDNGYSDLCRYLQKRSAGVNTSEDMGGVPVPPELQMSYLMGVSEKYQRYYILFRENVINRYENLHGGFYRYYSDSEVFFGVNKQIEILNQCREALIQDGVNLPPSFIELPSLNATEELSKSVLKTRENAFIEWLASDACVKELLQVDVSATTGTISNYTMSVQGSHKTFQRIQGAVDIDVYVSFCNAQTLGKLLGLYNDEGELDQTLADFLIADPQEYLTQEERQVLKESGSSPVETEVLLNRGAIQFLESSKDAAGVANSVLMESGFAKSDNFWQYRIKVAANLFNYGTTESSALKWFFDENFLVKDNDGLYKIDGPYRKSGSNRDYYLVYCQPNTVVYLPFSCMRAEGTWLQQVFGETYYTEHERNYFRNAENITPLYNKANMETVQQNVLDMRKKVGNRNFELQDVNYTYVIGNIQTAELDTNKDSYRLRAGDYHNGTYLTTGEYQNIKTYYEYFDEKLDNHDTSLKDITTPIILGTVTNTQYLTNYQSSGDYSFDSNNLDSYPYFVLSVESTAESVLHIDNQIDLKKLFNLKENSELQFNSSNGYCWPVLGSYDNQTILYTVRNIDVLSVGDSHIIYRDGELYYKLSNVLPAVQNGAVGRNGVLGTAMGNNAVLESGTWNGNTFTAKSIVNDQTLLKKIMRVDLREDAVTSEIPEGAAGSVVAMTPGRVVNVTDGSILMYKEEDGLYVEYNHVIPTTQVTTDAYFASGQNIGYVLWNGSGNSYADVSVYCAASGTRVVSSDENGRVKALTSGTVSNVEDGNITVFNTGTHTYYTYSGFETVNVSQGDEVIGSITVVGESIPGTQHTVFIHSEMAGQNRYMYPAMYFNELEDVSNSSMKIYIQKNDKTVTDIIVNQYRSDADIATVTAKILPTSMANSPITWTITEGADKIAITPSENTCSIRGVSAGDAYIEISSGQISTKLHVYVPEYISMINIYDRSSSRNTCLIPSVVYDISRTTGSMDLDAFTNDDATYQGIKWSIDAEHRSFAEIDEETGEITFKKGMTKNDCMKVTATATDGSGYSTTVQIRIVEPATRIVRNTSTIIPVKLTGSGYQRVNLHDYFTVEPNNATYTDATFMSQNSSIYVDYDGIVQVRDRSAVGRTIAVTVKLDDYAATFSPSCNQIVLMVQIQYDIASISLNGPYLLFAPDGKNVNTDAMFAQIDPVVTPAFSELQNNSFTWTSSNASVISVDTHGGVDVRANKPGKYSVTASLMDKSASTSVYVKSEPRVAVVPDVEALRRSLNKQKYLNNLTPIQDVANAAPAFEGGSVSGCVFCIQNPPDNISFQYDKRIGNITPMKLNGNTIAGLYSFQFAPTSDQSYMDVTATYQYTIDGKQFTFTQEFYFEEN